MTAILNHGDCLAPRGGLADLPDGEAVVITDPVWPNAPRGLFGVTDPLALFTEAAQHFPRIARRVVVWLGCDSDPRFLFAVPQSLPYVRTCWLRFACPSYKGTILYGGDVAYAFGSKEGPHGMTVLPGECTSHSSKREGDGHPTPRKVEHALWLVKMFTQPGDLIIDPFAGSGTTGVAAKYLGRNFIGWEKDPEHAARAERRIAAVREQADLFAEASA